MSKTIAWSIALLAAFVSFGCSSDDGLNHGGRLTGTVRIDGAPVSAGEVHIYGADGKHSASGKLRNDGSYAVLEPPLGLCKISIVTSTSKDIPPKAKAKGPVDFTDRVTGEWPIYVATPKAYEDQETSGLTVEVRRGSQEHNVDLVKSKK